MKIPKSLFILWLLSIIFFISGCSPILKNEQVLAVQSLELTPGHTIGQSFVAGERGLSGIDILVEPIAGDSTLILSLYPDSNQDVLITTAQLPLQGTDQPSFQRFIFPALKDSAKADYFLSIQIERGAGAILSVSAGDSYLNGALYQDQTAQDMQLAFRLTYDRLEFGFGLLGEAAGWGWYFLLAAWLFILPGWAILKLTLGDTWERRRWAEKAALAAGVGAALYPQLLLWLDLFHLRLGNIFSWLFPAASAIYLAWKNRSWFALQLRSRLRWNRKDLVLDFTLLAVVGLIFFARFWVIRGVEAPLWGDSYQHTVITQLIAENRGLFDSWRPYEPYQSLTVQYGFSANTAAWMWLTGMRNPQAVLVFGQLENIFAIIVLYPLAVKLARGSRWAGIACLVVAGLISTMPAFYVNWGRYAQLTGQVILPVALCLLWDWLEEPRPVLRQVALHGMILSGLLLSYYRMAFYYAAFIPVLGFHFFIHGPWGKHFSNWKMGLLKIVILCVVALIFISPWIPNVSGSSLSDVVESGITQISPVQAVLNDYQAWRNYETYVPLPMIVMIAVSLLFSLVFKRFEVLGILLWLGLISLGKAGSLIHIPGANLMQSYMVMISLYLFTSLGISWSVGWVLDRAGQRYPLAGNILAVMLILAFSFYGLNQQRKILNPVTYALVTRPDLRAMEWIRSHTPPDSVFLVEGFRIYGGVSAVGSDAGWWIPLLTQRRNTMPPQYALLNEQPEVKEHSKDVVDLVAKLEKHSPLDPALRADLCRWGITHIYVGQQQGKASIEKLQLFPAELDLASGVAQPVYVQDRVRIYAFSAGICNAQSSQ